MVLRNVDAWHSVKIISIFDQFARIRLFKPTLMSLDRGSFYLVAQNVQPPHEVAVMETTGSKEY